MANDSDTDNQKVPKVTGRPRKEIDWVQLDEMCLLHCTLMEISSLLRMDEKTIRLRVKERFGIPFSEYYRDKSAEGKKSLRRAMWHNALKRHNSGMQIHLHNKHLDPIETDQLGNAGPDKYTKPDFNLDKIDEDEIIEVQGEAVNAETSRQADKKETEKEEKES